jgi:putative ABC transport system permease protein
MFKNYFTIAIRTFRKNKIFSAINVLGLAIGVSASLVIYLLVNYHLTFDKFEKDNDRIYRVVSNFNFSGESFHNSGVSDPLAAAVRREITGLDAVIAFRKWDGDAKISVPQASKNDPKIFNHEGNLVFADSNYFNMVNYDWIIGSPKISFRNPYQVVLTESKEKLYFPGLNVTQVAGKEIYIDDTIRATITGVVKDLDKNSDFDFKTFIAYSTLENSSLKPENWDTWDNTNGAQQLFVKLAAGSNPVTVGKQITQLQKINTTKDPNDHSLQWLTLQPLSDVHFNADYGTYDLPVASRSILYSLLAVAAFLLILGCINFINLATAQASQRAKEIGIRKTMGSSKKQLISQFLSETFLLTFTATILSVVLTPLILKAFSGFIPKELHFNLTAQPGIIIFLLLLIVVVTLLSGFYPALVLSGYKPVLVLKNQVFTGTAQTRKAWLRKSLTVSQFVIAQVFIMATLLVSKQIHYSLSKNMGFKKDAIVYVTTNYYDTVRNHKYLLMDKLKSIPEISMISLCTNPPSSNNTWSGTLKYKDGKKEIEADVQQKYGDSNYIKLYHIKLLAGKNIQTTDTLTSVIINETYSHILGFQHPEQAVGKNLEWNKRNVLIAGVVGDFNQQSLHQAVKPLLIASRSLIERNISIALQQQNAAGTTWKTAIAKIEKVWEEVYPGDDFEYHFLDEDIAKYYTAEQNISSLLKWSTGLAVFISCLGLLGLVIYTTTERTKEIGVRKVLGASVMQIVSMISKNFIVLVLLAFVIAAPLAWIGINKWLENFAYRTQVSWWIFFVSGAAMVIIALITLGFQTIKAAMANPVKSLRTE